MKLVKADTKRLKKDFINLYYRVYAGCGQNRDNFNHAAASFLYGGDSFSRGCMVEPLLVEDGGTVMARAVFLHHPRLDALQLGFFEALPDSAAAVDVILAHGRKLAESMGLGRIIIGLNGHLTYGVGFLKDGHDIPAAFDGAYSADYYPAYFAGRGFTEYGLTTYYADADSFAPPARLFERAYSGISYRQIRFGEFEREMGILGGLFNRTLCDTRYYFYKEIRESCEMIRSIRPLLDESNIIYAMKDGREIGFVIWHPNFNEVLADNRRINPLLFFAKCRLFKRRIKEMRINTIGVLPEYEHSGASFGLINEVFKRVRGVYRGGETSFVWDDNIKSSLFCKATCARELRHYSVFEWNLDGAA